MTGSPRPSQAALGDAFIMAWQGVPFLWDGRTRAGVDCWGLAMLFYRIVKGEALPDWRRGAGPRSWAPRTLAREARTHWAALAAPVDGCLVKVPGHIGICWRGSVLHAAEGRGVVWERLADFLACYPAAEFGQYRP